MLIEVHQDIRFGGDSVWKPYSIQRQYNSSPKQISKISRKAAVNHENTLMEPVMH